MFITTNGLAVNDGAAVRGGVGIGDVGEQFQRVHFDEGLLRPYLSESGEICVTANAGTKFDKKLGKRVPVRKAYAIRQLKEKGLNHPVWNLVSNATTLRKEEWIEIDRRVVRARRNRIQAWPDLVKRNQVSGLNGMGKMTYEYEAMTDPGEAVVDMDPITDGRNDQPLFKLRSIPLPVTHSDFSFSERRAAVSRNSGTPIGTTMAEAAGRRVAEMVEKTTIGTETGTTYGTVASGNYAAHDGTSTSYGYTNFTHRVTKTDLTTPNGTNPEAVMTDILEMVETMQTNGYYGPYTLYHSTGYSRYLSDDYFRTGSTSAVRSLRQRLMEIEGIQDIIRLDYLTSGFQLILVQHDPEVVEAINAMDVTTVQWVEKGGLQLCFKVMCIQVALFKAPYNGVAGVIHGTTS